MSPTASTRNSNSKSKLRKVRSCRRRTAKEGHMGISINPATLLNGQGINVTDLVQQVLSQQSGPLILWENEQSTLQTQASAITSINNDLNSLATAVQALSDPLGALSSLS